MDDAPDMPCDNEFCLHHVVNAPGMISDWNKTRCGMYDIDPFEPGVQRESGMEGFRTDTCPARLRFLKLWAVERKWLKKKLEGG